MSVQIVGLYRDVDLPCTFCAQVFRTTGTNDSASCGVSQDPFCTEVRVDNASSTRLRVSEVVMGRNVSMLLQIRGARGVIAVSGHSAQKLSTIKIRTHLYDAASHFLAARIAEILTGTVISCASST